MAAGDRIVIPAQAAGFFSLLGRISKGTGDTLNLPEGMVNIGGNGRGYLLQAQVDWDPCNAANNDASFAVLTLGDDIYIYAVQQATGIAKWIASKNATYPTGYDATTSRKIGGFHYGRVRPLADRYTIGAALPVQIVPNSCWDLGHRPRCPDPSGMVEIGDFWIDIYLASEDGTAWPDTVPLSRYGATPLTGVEGYSYYDYNRLARNAGKRLPRYGELLQAAYGVPEGATGAGARIATGGVGWDPSPHPYWMVSCLGVDQPSGNVFQACDEFVDMYNGSTTADGAYTSTAVNAGKDSAMEQGAVYAQAIRQLLFGGYWDFGAIAGARCADLYNAPWNVSAYVGLRCVSDSL